MSDELANLAADLAAAVGAGQTTPDEADRALGRRAFELLIPDDAAAPAPPLKGDARLAAVLRNIADRLGDPAAWKPAPEYPSVALAAMDAIWSINARYIAVLNVVARYQAARVEQGADASADTSAQLLAFIDGCGSSDAFAAAVSNRQRTSPTNGILKAEAVRQAAAILYAHAVTTPADLRSMAPANRGALEREWRAIRGQASGLSWDYFLMLCGVSGVKADRMIRRFVADALEVGENSVSAGNARDLVVAAATALGVDSRVLDFAIWEASSSRPNVK